ncbi:hypothetical protein AgCh_021258 [Apium graveolens]
MHSGETLKSSEVVQVGSKLKLEFNGLTIENLKLKAKFKAQVRGQSLNWFVITHHPDWYNKDGAFRELENVIVVLKNGVEVKLQRNALSVLEHLTGNEVDEEFNFDSSSNTNIGERENDIRLNPEALAVVVKEFRKEPSSPSGTSP